MNYEVIPNKTEKLDFVREFRKNLIRVHNSIFNNTLTLDENNAIDMDTFGKKNDGKYDETFSEFLKLALIVEGLTEDFEEVSYEELTSIADELKGLIEGV